MRALIQRATEARVSVDGRITGEIGAGLVVLVCAMQGDGDAEAERLARKLVNLRIFRDADGRMNRSLIDAGGSASSVQPVHARGRTRGNRPGFVTAAPPEVGKRLYELFHRARPVAAGSRWPPASFARL